MRGKPFPKGVSGNVGGRPKSDPIFKKHCHAWTIKDGFKKLKGFAASDDEKIAFAATSLIIAYSIGKPTEPVEHGFSEGTLEQLIAGSKPKSNTE